MSYIDPLWSHQHRALEWLQWNECHGRKGVMLAMGMGTGKTRIAIEWMTRIPTSNPNPCLVFCPKAVLDVWRTQLRKFSANLHPLILDDGSSLKLRAAAIKTFVGSDNTPISPRRVVIMNYEALAAPPNDHVVKAIASRHWACCILDESHRIKMSNGLRSKTLFKIREWFNHRLALTGTPMPHSPDDIYGQFRFLDPTILGTSHAQFKFRYAIFGNIPGVPFPIIRGWKNQQDLADRLSPSLHKVNRDDVLDLPDEIHVDRYVDLGANGNKAYHQLKDDMVTWVKSGGTVDEPVTASNALVRLLRLQQVTGGMVPTEDGRSVRVSTGKMEMLDEVLDELDPTEPVVILCRFKTDIEMAKEVCRAAGRGVAELSGRQMELPMWLGGGAPCLVAQQQCAKEGIDLTRARYCILWSINWSLGDYEQALARIRRPGQKASKVVYVHLLARDTVDEDLLKALRDKKDAVQSVLERMRWMNAGS